VGRGHRAARRSEKIVVAFDEHGYKTLSVEVLRERGEDILALVA
jgi:hypothetical protein